MSSSNTCSISTLFDSKTKSSTVLCSTALTETIEYYVSRKTPVYVLLIDAIVFTLNHIFSTYCESLYGCELFNFTKPYNVKIVLMAENYTLYFSIVS